MDPQPPPQEDSLQATPLPEALPLRCAAEAYLGESIASARLLYLRRERRPALGGAAGSSLSGTGRLGHPRVFGGIVKTLDGQRAHRRRPRSDTGRWQWYHTCDEGAPHEGAQAGCLHQMSLLPALPTLSVLFFTAVQKASQGDNGAMRASRGLALLALLAVLVLAATPGNQPSFRIFGLFVLTRSACRHLPMVNAAFPPPVQWVARRSPSACADARCSRPRSRPRPGGRRRLGPSRHRLNRLGGPRPPGRRPPGRGKSLTVLAPCMLPFHSPLSTSIRHTPLPSTCTPTVAPQAALTQASKPQVRYGPDGWACTNVV